MHDLIAILLYCGSCFAAYKVGHIATTMFLNKYGKKKPKSTQKKMAVGAKVQKDIVDVINHHKLNDEQVLSTFIYLAGVSVNAAGQQSMCIVDHTHNKTYTILVKDN